MSTPVEAADRYRYTRNVTIVGGIVDLVLGIVKIVVGFVAHSQALIADGVHSLSDLATDMLVIWAARHASREPDPHHPYGHQRIETVATITLGLMLAGVALGIAYDSVYRIIHIELILTPGVWALVVAGFSVVAKEAIYHYTMRAANRLESPLLRSNAWHSRSDALSSIIVIIGVAGAMAGFSYLDAGAAVVVALMIIWIGGKMIWAGIQELIDQGLDPERVKEMIQALREVEGVFDIHDFRTRRMGSDIFVDGHILVDPKLSVSEGHRIGEAVREKLRQEFLNVSDFTVHIDAEDDAAYQRSDQLPLRSELLQRLRQHWKEIPAAQDIRHLTLHYLDGEVHVELWLPLKPFRTIAEAEATARQLQAAAEREPAVHNVAVLLQSE